VWPDGTTNAPSETRTIDSECPFDQDLAEKFDNGIMLSYLISFILLAITLIISGIIWRKYWNMDTEKLTIQ
jgi:hypothetical protein